MYNLGLFLISCAFVALAAWAFARAGQHALIAWIAVQSLLANLFVLKQIALFGFNATAADVYAIGSLLGLNILQEKYGKTAAQNAIWVSFGCLIFFIMMAQVHLFYEPSLYDRSQEAYALLLAPSPRILIASIITFFTSQQVDRFLFKKCRDKLPQLSFVWASAFTLVFSQCLDTVLFSLLGLYGLVSALFEVMIVSYFIKLLAIGATLPWTFLSRKILLSHAR